MSVEGFRSGVQDVGYSGCCRFACRSKDLQFGDWGYIGDSGKENGSYYTGIRVIYERNQDAWWLDHESQPQICGISNATQTFSMPPAHDSISRNAPYTGSSTSCGRYHALSSLSPISSSHHMVVSENRGTLIKDPHVRPPRAIKTKKKERQGLQLEGQ